MTLAGTGEWRWCVGNDEASGTWFARDGSPNRRRSNFSGLGSPHSASRADTNRVLGSCGRVDRCQRDKPSNCALLLIVFPPSALHELLAPLFPNPRAWEATAIRLPTAEIRATIRVMAVNAFAAPRRRTFWKWQWGCLVAQKAFMTQPLGSRARQRPCGNAHRVPRQFERSRQLCLRHHSPNFLRRSLLRPVNRIPEVEAATSFVSR